MLNTVIIIAGVILICAIIFLIKKEWNTDTYDITDFKPPTNSEGEKG